MSEPTPLPPQQLCGPWAGNHNASVFEGLAVWERRRPGMRQKEERGTMVTWRDLKTNTTPPKESVSGSPIQCKRPLVWGISPNDYQVTACLHSLHGLRRIPTTERPFHHFEEGLEA